MSISTVNAIIQDLRCHKVFPVGSASTDRHTEGESRVSIAGTFAVVPYCG
jgi:hypothetical protein